MLFKLSGSCPVKLLFCKLKSWMPDKFPKESGIVPLILLVLKDKTVNRARFPKRKVLRVQNRFPK